jgi:hypothetical protein
MLNGHAKSVSVGVYSKVTVSLLPGADEEAEEVEELLDWARVMPATDHWCGWYSA